LQVQITIDSQRYQVDGQEKQADCIEQQRQFNVNLEERQRQFQLNYQLRLDNLAKQQQACTNMLLREQKREEAQTKRINRVQKWIEQGKTPLEIQMLTNAMYRLGGLGA
jgi:hypothetical protein